MKLVKERKSKASTERGNFETIYSLLIQYSVQFSFARCFLFRNTLTRSNGMTVTWTGPCVSSSGGQASVSSSTVEPGRGVTWPSSSSSSSCSVGVSDDRVILSTCKVVRFCCLTFPLGKTASKNTGQDQLNDAVSSWRNWKTNTAWNQANKTHENITHMRSVEPLCSIRNSKAEVSQFKGKINEIVG